METKSFVPEELAKYIREVSLREPEILRRLREETAAHPESQMQITPEQGQLLQVLVRATGAKRTLEIGVFTGYSSLAVALALPEGGHLTALDANQEWTGVARRYWQEAGVSHKIDLRIGRAVDLLDELRKEGHEGSYDFAFIDADKPSYGRYFEQCLPLLKRSGLIAIDNTLQKGYVANRAHSETNTVALRDFNRQIHSDLRVGSVLLPIADGLTLAVKL